MKRMTKQRQSILECFKNVGRPLGIEEILEEAGKTVPQLNLATVYRNLKILMNEGLILPVDLPGMKTRYESFGLHHHHHFFCKKCNKVFDVKGCPEGITSLVPAGFKLVSHAITLDGYCDVCVGIA